MAVFEFLDPPKLISRKICVTKKFYVKTMLVNFEPQNCHFVLFHRIFDVIIILDKHYEIIWRFKNQQNK